MVGGPRAVEFMLTLPEGGSTGPSCLACPVRSFIILPLLLSLRLESAACHACDCALSSLLLSLVSSFSRLSLSPSLSHSLSLSMHMHACEMRAYTHAHRVACTME